MLEACATWQLYVTLKEVKAPEKVAWSIPGGTPVTMYAPDDRQIATGAVTLDRPAIHGGVKVTQSRIVMVVHPVRVPGYLISPTLLASHTPTPLSAFGPPPFSVLGHVDHLQTSSILEIPLTLPGATAAPISLDASPILAHPDSDSNMESTQEQSITGSEIDPVALEAISQLILDVLNYGPEFTSPI
ncbi:hypothetical protein PAXRUDRAFT_19887 [Paxillus rubicundulus Ve08.2h10]|uniref:Unplaced genomic scaffold scaffold_4055, whole genome shotgun sequence n=1 Tax=Paxillus rubicundulus Ve08.2h10 TaxID=930991 RepID=A0A0D0DB50_9AGAM|nr:hypothetical protein PAXRUDRAFT_19887 [Paxillus rubicundulus Ve08.2h10]